MNVLELLPNINKGKSSCVLLSLKLADDEEIITRVISFSEQRGLSLSGMSQGLAYRYVQASKYVTLCIG